LFSSRQGACLVVSEVFKGFKVRDFGITVKEITFGNRNLIYVIRNVSFTSDFKKFLENALRFVTDVCLEYFAMLSRFYSRGPSHELHLGINLRVFE